MPRCGGCGGVCGCAVSPTTSVALLGNGQPTTPWEPSVRRSVAIGNTLQELGDGLFVGTQAPAPVVVADTNSINLSGDGTGGNPISGVLQAAPFVDGGWVPSQVTGGAASYANVTTNPTRDVVIPYKGWLRIAFSAYFSGLGSGANLAFRLVPMTSVGAVDTAIAQYDQFRIEGILNTGILSLNAVWYIPSARSMKVGAQYNRNGATGSMNINAALSGSVGLVPAVIEYTPDLT